MSDLLLITSALEPSAEVLPALGLLLHPVRVLPADASALVEAPPADAVLIDARRELVQRQEHLPPAADDGPGLPALRDRDRGRPRGGQRRVGRR